MRLAWGCVVLAGLAMPAAGDEVEDAIGAALDAYRAGDIAVAAEEIAFASALLAQMKAQGLAAFLPAAMPGWEKTEGEQNALAAQALGGGMIAEAEYSGPAGRVEIRMFADSPLVASMGMVFSTPALMAAQGEVKRINRQKVLITRDGELSALVANRVLVQIGGDAPVADKEAYFAAIDMAGLAGL